MSIFTKRTALISTLLLAINAASAAPPPPPPPPGPGPKPGDTAESCRQAALKLDWLARYQDRAVCTENLDGASVYFASNYILASRISEAKALLDRAIIKTKFAIDINCYGQDDMKAVLKNLQDIQQSI